MSVASANPFAILIEETSRPSSPAPASQKKEAPSSQSARTAAKSKGPASRGGRYYSRGGKPRDSTQDGQEETPVGDESAPKKDGEGRGRGRGRGRGDRGRGRGRPFDKHSATGKTDSDKKIHQGWGGDEGSTELKAEEAGTTDAQAEGVAAAAADAWDPVPIDPWSAPPPADSWGAPPAEGDAAPVAEDEKGGDDRKPRDRDPEEDDNTISYDQYLSQMKDGTTSSVPKLEGVREANEGADDAWGDVVEHKKNEDDQAYFVGGKAKTTGKARAEKKEKVYIEIDAHFERSSRGGRGRGGDRGRGRGGRGTRGPRSNGAQRDIRVDNEADFPSLS